MHFILSHWSSLEEMQTECRQSNKVQLPQYTAKFVIYEAATTHSCD